MHHSQGGGRRARRGVATGEHARGAPALHSPVSLQPAAGAALGKEGSETHGQADRGTDRQTDKETHSALGRSGRMARTERRIAGG
jgi:hypothetical protein